MNLPADAQELVHQLQQEREALVAAWEKLEQEYRLLTLQPSAASLVASTGVEFSPRQVASEAAEGSPSPRLSKKSQFLQLQREIDCRNS